MLLVAASGPALRLQVLQMTAAVLVTTLLHAAAAGAAAVGGAACQSDSCRLGLAAEPSDCVGGLLQTAGVRVRAAPPPPSAGAAPSGMLATDVDSPPDEQCLETVPMAVPEVEQCMQDHFSSFQQGVLELGAHGFSLNRGLMLRLFCELFDSGLQPSPRQTQSAKQLGVTPCKKPRCAWWNCRCWNKEMMKPGIEDDVFPAHIRRDAAAPACAGQGELVSDWMRPTRLRRYLPQLGEEMPSQVGVKTTEEYIASVNSVLSADGGEFHVTCPKQLAAIQKRIAGVRWNNVIIHLWAAPPDQDGIAYSPAFNSIFVVWCKATRRLSHYMIIAADAEGNPRTKYIGISFGTVYRSITGTLYTPLTISEQNPLHYRLPRFDPMNLHKPWSFDIWVWREHLPPPKHSWYIQVSTALQCVEGGGQIPSIEQVVAKEYYMSRIMWAYYGRFLSRNVNASSTIATFKDNLVPWQHIASCKKVASEYKKLIWPAMAPAARAERGVGNDFPWVTHPACQKS